MDIGSLSLRRDEEAVLTLRALYESYGYTKYRMSKFEEYDFYGENKSFLQSDRILTFTDLSGRLMALKPDITLSIVKNAREGVTEKVYYSENVYRAAEGEREFREITQVGLECIGRRDSYAAAEVISLAAQSLFTISPGCILDVSHMGLILGLLSATGLPLSVRGALGRCIGQKNAHELREVCERNGVPASLTEKLVTLITLYGPFEKALPLAETLDVNNETHAALCELEELFPLVRSMGGGARLNLDFSIVNDMNYYNGVIFQGFVEGVPVSVLSGGSYDNLLRRLGKTGGAIGFAVYLGLLERYVIAENPYDAEALLLYGRGADPAELEGCASTLRERFGSVRVQPDDGGERPRCRRSFMFENGEARALD